MFNVDAPRPNLSFLHNVGGKITTSEKGVDMCGVLFMSSDGEEKLGTILQCNEQPVGNTGSNISEISGDKRPPRERCPGVCLDNENVSLGHCCPNHILV